VLPLNYFCQYQQAIVQRFANPDVTDTLLAYLARFREFGANHEKMKYVVGLLHRQAVRAKAEGLFFRASTLDLFKHILAEAKTLPKDQSYKDLLALVNFILRKFFKAVEQEPFLVIETFFSKNRGHWKDYSSLTPEELALKTGKALKSESVVDRRFPADVQVKKGWSWSEQVGIAILALVDEGHQALVEWSREVSVTVPRNTHVLRPLSSSHLCSHNVNESPRMLMAAPHNKETLMTWLKTTTLLWQPNNFSV
jgi:replication fork protection complex subunit Tof1/Swi1